ncbi:hypothetical protein JYU34_012520 [Plutella xylostella]|uniref:Uncharacterized protein n=1 Tax=Plutella xylostella TaxID=51655 RepID=A0ABQ7QBI2_PLUXY|nr:hypothetical protein JYU34_012520 [Plutella xylostella]
MAALLLLKSMLLSKALQKSTKEKKPDKKTKQPKQKQNAFSYRSGTCRVCSQSTADIPIFNNHLEPHLADEILHFSGVFIIESNMFPKMMCESCYQLLRCCITFRDMCQRTDKELWKSHSLTTDSVEDHATENNSILVKKTIEDNVNEIKVEEFDIDHDHFDDNDVFHSEISDKTDDIKEHIKSDSVNLISEEVNNKLMVTKDLTTKAKGVRRKPSQKRKSKSPTLKKTIESSKAGVKTKNQSLCDNCGKICPSIAHLRIHMTTHYNIFPFKCDVCPYKGRTKYLLTVHKRSHLAIKPYKCSLCPKTAISATNLKRHMEGAHNVLYSRPIKCPHCEKVLKTKTYLKRHVYAVHENLGNTECEICTKVMRKKHMRKHLWRVHKIQPQKPTLPNKLPSYILCNRALEQSHQQHTEHSEELTNSERVF